MLLALMALACTDGSGELLGGDIGIPQVNGAPAPESYDDMDPSRATCQEGDSVLSLSPSEGTVDVVHDNIALSCCGEYEADWVVEGQTVTVTYEDVVGGTCEAECDCPWTLSYSIVNLPAGEWTIDAPGASDTVVVP